MALRTPSRTAFLAAALGAALLLPAAARAWPDSATARDLAFAVTRAGEPMGNHSLSFRRDGENLQVDIAIELEVRLAFITVFRYSHRNSETWRAGRLIRLETTTNDDGMRHQVRAEATAEGLRVTDSAGRSYLAPADTIPTSYWNIETLKRQELLNTQDGHMMPIRVETRAADAARDHYRLVMIKDGDGTPIDVWYDRQTGAWAKLAFEARGSKIDYEPVAVGNDAQQAHK